MLELSEVRKMRAKRLPRHRQAWIRKNININWKASFYLWGNVGIGKTFAALGLVNKSRMFQLLKQGFVKDSEGVERHYTPSSISYYNIPTLIGRLRYCDINDRADILDGIKCDKMIILDDLGAEHKTEFSEDALLQIIDHRYNNCMYTGITSNLPLEKLPYGLRIISRTAGIVCNNRCEIKGRDRRI